MSDTRPKANIPDSSMEKIIEIVSLVILVAVSIYTIVVWRSLPDYVPTQFNIFGDVDFFGPKNAMLIFPAILLGLYVVFTVISWFPHAFPYVVIVTDENYSGLYTLAKKFLSILRLEIVLLFAYMNVAGILLAKLAIGNMGKNFFYVTVAVVLATIVVFIMKQVQKK